MIQESGNRKEGSAGRRSILNCSMNFQTLEPEKRQAANRSSGTQHLTFPYTGKSVSAGQKGFSLLSLIDTD